MTKAFSNVSNRRKSSYEASPIKLKRTRRTQSAMQEIRDAIIEVIKAERRMTVRQIFYRLVAMGVIEKTEAAYKATVCRLLVDMRRSGEIDYSTITDGTRWQRKPRTYSSLRGMLEQSIEFYRRAMWDSQEVYVEVWLEKEALAGVLLDVTARWDVPLMVTRGYPSLSYLHSAAEQIATEKKPTYLYYFGDHDPSGVDIPQKIISELRGFAPKADIHFHRVAVTPAQIEEFGLTTRPTKKTDTRSKNFIGESVEVDAIAPNTLRQLASHCITQHINQNTYERMLVEEGAERDTLRHFSATLNGGAA